MRSPRTSPSPRVGDRCVLRHRLPDGSATDLIGVLTAVDDDAVTLSPRPDETVSIMKHAVVAIKVVPEIPRGRSPRRTSPAELERLAALGWADHREPLGEWWLRAAGGFTGRANSVCAVGDPGRPLPAAAAAVIDFAARHGIAPMAQVITGSAEEAGLLALGWVETYETTDVLVHRLSELVGTRPAASGVEVADALDDRWYDAYRRYRRTDTDPAVVRRVLRGDGTAVGLGSATAADDDDGSGTMISIGRAHLSRDWVGVSALWTDPGHRRRGHATAVLIALGRWAARRGARSVYLQVAQANADAHQAYARLGFVPHHTYRYLTPT